MMKQTNCSVSVKSEPNITQMKLKFTDWMEKVMIVSVVVAIFGYQMGELGLFILLISGIAFFTAAWTYVENRCLRYIEFTDDSINVSSLFGTKKYPLNKISEIAAFSTFKEATGTRGVTFSIFHKYVEFFDGDKLLFRFDADKLKNKYEEFSNILDFFKKKRIKFSSQLHTGHSVYFGLSLIKFGVTNRMMDVINDEADKKNPFMVKLLKAIDNRSIPPTAIRNLYNMYTTYIREKSNKSFDTKLDELALFFF